MYLVSLTDGPLLGKSCYIEEVLSFWYFRYPESLQLSDEPVFAYYYLTEREKTLRGKVEIDALLKSSKAKKLHDPQGIYTFNNRAGFNRTGLITQASPAFQSFCHWFQLNFHTSFTGIY